MKRSYKRGTFDLAAVGETIRTSRSLAEAARKLGLDRSTLFRWQRAGHLPESSGRLIRRRQKRAESGSAAAPTSRTPEAWAHSVRSQYELSSTEDALVDLAAAAYGLSQDPTQPPAVRLTAMGRYQLLVKQLNLEEQNDGEIEVQDRDVRPFPRKVG
jgi:hypothetical protein